MNQEQDKNKDERVIREEEILDFWQKEEIFEKTLETNKREFVFYDGPPFANGMPHYGHLLASFIKDTIPRYKTMRGFRVPRRWGWDCHGLPVENEVEKQLELKGKNQIVDYGVEKFNQVAGQSVLRYAEEWRKTIKRVGRFVDMEDDYRTMDYSYTESIWWVFKNLYDRKLIYEGFKPMHLCPRCETTLSNLEVSQGYKDITDISVTVKFKLNSPEKIGLSGDVFVLAWTTTPWTLTGNVALAVSSKEKYVVMKIGGEVFVSAKDRMSVVFPDQTPEILKEILGSDLIGLEYEPVFDTFSKKEILENKENAWKIYDGDFVTMEDGTGIVHIAPGFGEDDLNLALKNNLPIVSHIGQDGIITEGEFKGLSAKPKEAPDQTDIEVLKNLAGRNLLFAKQKINHSYPHCWRCESPLLNFATSSWFVKVTDLKNKLVSENKKIKWVPKDVGEGRFGNWLEGARDWAISRSRFWGAPIPVWKCDDCKEIKVVGSVNDLEKKSNNNFILIRHGEAESNVNGVTSGLLTSIHNLTPKGILQIKESAKRLKGEKIDLIFYSPLRRTRETAMIVKDVLGLGDEVVREDKRLREINFGPLENKSSLEYQKTVGSDWEDQRVDDFQGVEGRHSIRQRVIEFISEIDKDYKGKNILIVGHDTPLWILETSAQGLNDRQATNANAIKKEPSFQNAEFRKTEFKILPRNNFGDPDLHRPFIDNFEVICSCGKKMRRVPEVMDCWFESGAMPFASNHYPFEKEKFAPAKHFWQQSKGFPADFIAEGLDQTRGWFYALLVLSVALFGESPYKNVIVNGIILAESGEKMSKRLKNYPDPNYILDKYGSDPLRYYLLSSPVVRAESIKFSEKGVEEVVKKLINRLDNVLSFHELYKNEEALKLGIGDVKHKMNLWILARLSEMSEEITKAMENYELDRASRPIGDFIDDLSVWYLRRSREIFKDDKNKTLKNEAIFTLNFVLRQFSKILAPFMPFFAEYLYLSLGQERDEQSVHLTTWPQKELEYFVNSALIDDMAKIRKIASLSLEGRARIGIKVRQPLALVKIKDSGNLLSDRELTEILLDEINVKKAVSDKELAEDVWLDQNLTDDLKQEGMRRDIIRLVQDLRKKSNLSVTDKADLEIEVLSGSKEFFEKSAEMIANSTGLSRVMFSTGVSGEVLELYDGLKISVRLIK